MATLKLTKREAPRATAPGPKRAPVRGVAPQSRPTLAEAQAQRAERAEREASLAPSASPRPTSDRAPDRRVDRTDRAPDSRVERDPRRSRPNSLPSTRAVPPPRAAAPPLRQGERDTPRPPGNPRREHRATDAAAAASPTASAAQGRTDDGSLRLSKRMSELGIASRREADEWIARGWVRVDGRVVSELGSRVLPIQHISVDAKARNQQAQRVTVLLNKPVGYVSGQAEDGHEPAVVLITPQNQWREDRSGTHFVREHLRSLVPAGRLDIDSVGLLVLTQDGRVAKQLIGEDSELEKEYLVRVVAAEPGALADAALALLNHGLELDGEALRPARVEWINQDQLRFVLKQGKKRQIRRMCEAVGLKVVGLKRVRVGAVLLGDLPPGRWRYLRADEAFAASAAEREAAAPTSAG